MSKLYTLLNTLIAKVNVSVKTTTQVLTEDQKAQARANIGAISEVDVPQKGELDSFIANTDIDHAYDENTGVYYTVIRVYRDKLDGTKQYPFVYAPNGVGQGNKSTYDMTKSDGWLLALNAGIFNIDTQTPIGLLIQNGILLQGADTSMAHKYLTVDNFGNLGYAEPSEVENNLLANGIMSAVCGFAPIVIDFIPTAVDDYPDSDNWQVNAQRQIIGQFGNGDYAIVTSEGRNYHNSDGWTIAEAQTICVKLGLKFAYNLDGGGSTETVLGLKQINTIYENNTGRQVPTFIVFNGTDTFDRETHTQRVPNGYLELDYITAPVGAYFDTGIPTGSDYDAEYKASATGKHILSGAGYFYPFFRMVNENRVMTFHRCIMVDTPYQFSFNNTYTYKVQGDVASVLLDGQVVVSAEVLKGTEQTTGNLHMFAYGGAPTNMNYHFGGNLHYLKLFDKKTGVILYDFVPCKNPNGVIGLYETVGKKFYSSDTDVAFT